MNLNQIFLAFVVAQLLSVAGQVSNLLPYLAIDEVEGTLANVVRYNLEGSKLPSISMSKSDSYEDSLVIGSEYSLNVIDFGAIPDDSLDDSSAFIKAIDAAEGDDISIIQVPTGVYDFYRGVDLKTNIVIEGGDQNSTIITWHQNDSKHMFSAEGEFNNLLTNVAIKNLTLRGSGVETMGDCIHLESVINYLIQNTTLSDCGSGPHGAAIYARNTLDGKIMHNKIVHAKNGYLNPFHFDPETRTIGGSKNILIAYNVITDSVEDGIHPVNGTNNKIIGNTVIDSGDDNIDTFNERNIVIENNTIIMNTNSAHVMGFELGDGSEDILLKGNKVIGGALYAINISSDTKNFEPRINRNVTIFGNEVRQTVQGCVRILLAEDVTITDNKFEQCNTSATLVESNAIRIKERVSNLSITNNVIEYFSGKGRSGIFVDNSNSIEITNNSIRAKASSTGECIGIILRPLTDDILISNNDLGDCGCKIRNGSDGDNVTITNSFTVSSNFDGNSYTLSGRSQSVKVASFVINPEQSVGIELACREAGQVELTLPKNMIDGIHTVTAIAENSTNSLKFEQTASDSASNTIRFTVPATAHSLEINGIMVVPEFPAIAIMMLALASLFAIIGFRIIIEHNRGFR